MARETDIFLRDLLTRGLIFEKRVCKGNPTSGLIFVPIAFVGKRFRVILIPIETKEVKVKKPDVMADLDKALDEEKVDIYQSPIPEVNKETERFKIDTSAKEPGEES